LRKAVQLELEALLAVIGAPPDSDMI